MKALDQLKNEHQAVRAMLAVWRAIVKKMERSDEVNLRDMENLLAFMKGYVDKCHHSKEDTYLFPALMEFNIPGIKEIIKKLTAEHARLHALVQELDRSFEGYKKGDQRMRMRLESILKEYVAILSAHEAWETDELFSLAEKYLPEDAQDRLRENFTTIELKNKDLGKYEELSQRVLIMQESYSR